MSRGRFLRRRNKRGAEETETVKFDARYVDARLAELLGTRTGALRSLRFSRGQRRQRRVIGHECRPAGKSASAQSSPFVLDRHGKARRRAAQRPAAAAWMHGAGKVICRGEGGAGVADGRDGQPAGAARPMARGLAVETWENEARRLVARNHHFLKPVRLKGARAAAQIRAAIRAAPAMRRPR